VLLVIPSSTITDRSEHPWDNTDRCPSHRDKHKYLELQLLQNDLNTLLQSKPNPPKNIQKIESVYYDSTKNAETNSRKNQKIGQSRNFQRKKQQSLQAKQ
jgi:hypothetical protein